MPTRYARARSWRYTAVWWWRRGASRSPRSNGRRVRDLLAARSGVYLPAAYADASQDSERPRRGSHAPNAHSFYNNWDFNTLGIIYERVVDASLYRSIADRLARMDFRRHA